MSQERLDFHKMLIKINVLEKNFFTQQAPSDSEPLCLKFFQKTLMRARVTKRPGRIHICYCTIFPFLEQSYAVCCSYTFRPQTVEYQKRI